MLVANTKILYTNYYKQRHKKTSELSLSKSKTTLNKVYFLTLDGISKGV